MLNKVAGLSGNQSFNLKLEKKLSHLEVLEEELKTVNCAVDAKHKLAASLELDLEHAIAQLEKLSPSVFHSFSKHIYLPD